MNHSQNFLSCDWGSTSFRLRWVDGARRVVITELREASGVKFLFEEANRCGARDQDSRAPFFSNFLRLRIESLMSSQPSPSAAVPLFISGMASSTVGWRELHYANAPFPLDGSGFVIAELPWTMPPWVGKSYLISGVATEQEMMRGEETEIIGLMAEPSFREFHARSTIILPGTHSKHVQIKDGRIVDWRTFMTGELFEVLGTHSLLRASVDLKSDFDPGAFVEGVRWGHERGLAEALFRVRTRAVLGKRPMADNTSFFSGLLIGAELAGISSQDGNPPIILAASAGRLAESYQLAFQTIARPGMRWIPAPPDLAERTVISAHALLREKIA